MFGRKKKAQKREEHQQSLRKGLLFWLPGGSSRLDVYVDYCVIRCLGKTKMKEKERVIPFTSIQDVVYTPPTAMRLACLQLITKEMPDVRRAIGMPMRTIWWWSTPPQRNWPTRSGPTFSIPRALMWSRRNT